MLVTKSMAEDQLKSYQISKNFDALTGNPHC